MPKVTRSLQAAAEPAAVWDLAIRLPRVAEWNTMHEGFPGEVPEVLGEGTTFRQKVKLMGMPAVFAWQVTAAEAPGRLELSGEGPMGVTAVNRWSITPAATGSHVTLEWEFGGSAISGPMAMMVEKRAGSATAESLARFARLLG